MSIEAMKLALAALETCRIRSVSEWSVEDITPKNVTAAIAALRTAIQQSEVTDGIRPEDFTVDVVVKSMGGFAQINTKGVRVTHKPTGISVTCDAARSQHANRNQAFETLRAILAQQPATDEPVLTVEREPDYWSGGHFHKGDKPHINPMKVWSLPIGTKLYTRP